MYITNTHWMCALLAGMILAMTALTAPVEAEVVIVADGEAQATVVIPDSPTPVVTYAAEEFQYHVRRATGARLDIVKESEAREDGPYVYIGPCRATIEAGIDAAELPPNGFVLRASEDRFFLVGDDSEGAPGGIQHTNRTRVGTLFAVYEFLDRDLDVRWLWPGELGEVIPERSSIVVEKQNTGGEPRFIHTRWRDGSSSRTSGSGWSSSDARSKFLDEQGQWLRRHRFAMAHNMDMGHAYTGWWDRYGEEHPEYFNKLPDGTRRSDPNYNRGSAHTVSMCVSNPDLHKAIVGEWKENRDSSDSILLNVSENDTPGKCTCERCLSWDEPDPELDIPWEDRMEYAAEAFHDGDQDWYRYLGSLSDRYARFLKAVQEEAARVDPDVVVGAWAYTNYVRPPHDTRLNEDIIVGIVPPSGEGGWGLLAWTDALREEYRNLWSGWRATGARLFLRPNWTLDGHNMPMDAAEAVGEEFRFYANNGMIGTDFDSLNGQYATHGPTTYMHARSHYRVDLPVSKVVNEYYSAFGPAESHVRDYFAHWRDVQNALGRRPADSPWHSFYRGADEMYTPAAMALGRVYLERAREAAEGNPVAERRVEFLENGLRNAELTLAAQEAHDRYVSEGDVVNYRRALNELYEFRAKVESDNIANMSWLRWAENRTWHLGLVESEFMDAAEPLSDPWRFQWDPDQVGDEAAWYASDFDDSGWFEIGTDGPWHEQPVGEQWREEQGRDYSGVAWYRRHFDLPTRDDGDPVKLIFGAVDAACTIWVNGEKVLERPYPYQGNRDSWQESFEVDITDAIQRQERNVVAVRVDSVSGQGGIWRGVWISTPEPTAEPEANLIEDGAFEEQADAWLRGVHQGEFEFAFDRSVYRSSPASARLEAKEADDEGRVWARWWQREIAVEEGERYRFRAWVRTDSEFGGTVRVWIRGGARHSVSSVNTEGHWREVVVPEIEPRGDTLSLYLNLMDGIGTVWFDDIELTVKGG